MSGYSQRQICPHCDHAEEELATAELHVIGAEKIIMLCPNMNF